MGLGLEFGSASRLRVKCQGSRSMGLVLGLGLDHES